MVTTNYRFTVADLENFPDDGNRYEIIDGELYVSRAPHGRHQAVLDQSSSRSAPGITSIAWDNQTFGDNTSSGQSA